VDDLRLIEAQLGRVLERVVPATVGIQIGASAGSGVIISPEGLVLTAGHVSGEPGRPAVLIMPDGRQVRGRTLGLNRRIDSGLMQITEDGPWPYVQMAQSNEIEPGQWVVATGHPGGYSSERTPPVRLGRVLYVNNEVICTDCTLVGGDSGGPLFNMRAEVIGIHSRIGRSLSSNFHVPIATYHDTWDRLASGEVWGGRLPTDERGQVRPYLGMFVDGRGDGLRVTQVSPNTPADRAGIREGDVIVKFAGTGISSRKELIDELWRTRPGQRLEMEVQRGEETLKVRVVVAGISQGLPGSPEYEPREPRSRREDSRNRDREDESEREHGEQQPPEQEQEEKPQPEESGEPPQPEEEKEAPEDAKDPPADVPAPKADEKPAENAPQQPADEGRPAVDLASLGIVLDAVAVRGVVSRVDAGSAADAAGLTAGDVIAALNGVDTQDAEGIAQVLDRANPTDEIRIRVRRGGRELELVLAPRER
jgi:serine protease Do